MNASQRKSLHLFAAIALAWSALLCASPNAAPRRAHAQFNELDLSAPAGFVFVVQANTTFTVTLRAVNNVGTEISNVLLRRSDGACAPPDQCAGVVFTQTLPTFLDAFGTPADAVITFQAPPVAAGTSVSRDFTFTVSGRYFESNGTGIPPLAQALPGVWVPVASNPLVITVISLGPVLPTITPDPPTVTPTPLVSPTPGEPAPTATTAPATATVTATRTPPSLGQRRWLPAAMRDSGLEIEPNNHAGQAMAMIAQRQILGRFNDTYDVYRFATSNAGPMIIDMTGYPAALAGHVQAQLYYGDLLAASRQELAVTAPYRIVHTGPAGVYYVVIYTDPAHINPAAQYQLLASFTP